MRSRNTGMFYHRTQLCLLNLRIHHLLYFGEVAIYTINWCVPTASHKRKSARLHLPNGSYKCRGWQQCNNMMKCEYFCHPHTGKRFQMNDIITCSTTHVICIIKCPCGLCYVGKTSCSLKQTISEHQSSIRRNDSDYPVTVHFNDLKHDLSTF